MATRVNPAENLLRLIREAEATGKVVDVSKFGPRGGGGRLVTRETAYHNGLIEIEGLPIASNEYMNYVNAITVLTYDTTYDTGTLHNMIREFVKEQQRLDRLNREQEAEALEVRMYNKGQGIQPPIVNPTMNALAQIGRAQTLTIPTPAPINRAALPNPFGDRLRQAGVIPQTPQITAPNPALVWNPTVGRLVPVTPTTVTTPAPTIHTFTPQIPSPRRLELPQLVQATAPRITTPQFPYTPQPVRGVIAPVIAPVVPQPTVPRPIAPIIPQPTIPRPIAPVIPQPTIPRPIIPGTVVIPPIPAFNINQLTTAPTPINQPTVPAGRGNIIQLLLAQNDQNHFRPDFAHPVDWKLDEEGEIYGPGALFDKLGNKVRGRGQRRFKVVNVHRHGTILQLQMKDGGGVLTLVWRKHPDTNEYQWLHAFQGNNQLEYLPVEIY